MHSYRYLTCTEWITLYGGKKEGPETSNNFRRLPYDHCCVSLQPFDNPYCDPDGNIFEYEAILLYLKKFRTNPVTGKVSNFSFKMLLLYGYVCVCKQIINE